jgi:hypothetical protein
VDLQTLQDEIGRLLGDPAHDRWPLDVLTRRINIAQTNVNSYAGALKTKETLTPTASVSAVTLNANTMDINRVDITRTDGTLFSLPGVTRENLDFDYPNWQNLEAGVPVSWWYNASTQELNLIPSPDSANAITNGLFVTEIRKPSDLVNASDIPFDSNNQIVPYHMAVVYWVVAQCWADDGTPEALAKARYFKTGVMTQGGAGQYEQEVMRFIARFDRPESVPDHIKYRPTGGRAGSTNYPTHSNPFGGM